MIVPFKKILKTMDKFLSLALTGEEMIGVNEKLL